AGRRQHEHVAARLEEALEPFAAVLHHRAELVGAVMDDRAGQRFLHDGVQGRGSRREQTPLRDHAGPPSTAPERHPQKLWKTLWKPVDLRLQVIASQNVRAICTL